MATKRESTVYPRRTPNTYGTSPPAFSLDDLSKMQNLSLGSGRQPSTMRAVGAAGSFSSSTAGSNANSPGPEDIVIAVMGVTGSGKSTFIQHFNSDAQVGDGLESCTGKTMAYRCSLPNHRTVYLVDTPGFDDTYKTDVDILSEVANWLNRTYKRSILLTGIIYLHRIGDTRMGGSGGRNLRMFRKLCGEDSLGNVVLATTMWSLVGSSPVEYQKALNREQELMNRPEFWKRMIDQGSHVFRQDRGRESALKIVMYLLDRKLKRVTLDIQRDMVDQGFTLSETGAGREVEAEAAKQREMYEKRLKQMKQDMEQAIKERDRVSQKELAEYRREVERKMEDQKSAIERLRNEKFKDREEMKRELQAEKAALEQKLQDYRQQQQERDRKRDEQETAQQQARAENSRLEQERQRENETRREQARREGELNVVKRTAEIEKAIVSWVEEEARQKREREARAEQARQRREREVRAEQAQSQRDAELRRSYVQSNNNNNVVNTVTYLPVYHVPYAYFSTMSDYFGNTWTYPRFCNGCNYLGPMGAHP